MRLLRKLRLEFFSLLWVVLFEMYVREDRVMPTSNTFDRSFGTSRCSIFVWQVASRGSFDIHLLMASCSKPKI